jgi:YD repeat-containing protein
MRISYDPEVDALYISFLDTTVTTEEVADGIALDYDAHGQLAGIEILDALKRFHDQAVFQRIVFENLVPEPALS